jgi:hypothetical protein
MTTTTDNTDVTYDFGVVAERAIFLGLGIRRALILGSGIVMTTLATIAGVPIILAIGFIVLAVVAAFARVGGRRAEEWAAVIYQYGKAVATNQTKWVVGLPMGGLMTPGARLRQRRSESEETDHPLFGRCTFTETRVNGMPVGVFSVAAERSNALSAIFQVTGRGCFALMPVREQAQAISTWGSVLSESCTLSKKIRSIQWVQRSVPDLASEAETWMSEHITMAGTDSGPAFDDYAALLGNLDNVAATHEVYLVVQIRSAKRDIQEAILEAAPDWGAITSRLGGIGLSPRPLRKTDMVALLDACANGTASAPGLTATPSVMPMAIAEEWDHVRVDGLYHRSFTVTAWPRVRVWPSWLEPLLLSSSPGSLRTVSVHMHPVDGATASRRARAAMAASSLDEESRARSGFVISAQARREAADAEVRESELVAGYGEHQIGAVCMVSAATLDALELGSKMLVQGAGASGLDLRVLYGQQRAGYVAAVPLAQMRFARTVL